MGLRGISWQLRFLTLAVIWGSSFILIKISTEALAPLQVAFGRMAFGALALVAVLAARCERLPSGLRVWAHLAVAAVLLNAVPFTLFAVAEQRISSALAGICNAATPLFTLLVAVLALRDERPTRRGGAGLVVGFVGVLVVLGVWQGTAGQSAVGATMALGAAACYGLGWVYLRRHLTGSGPTSCPHASSSPCSSSARSAPAWRTSCSTA